MVETFPLDDTEAQSSDLKMDSLGSKAFFNDELNFDDDFQTPLGSRVFFNGVPDYEDFDSTLLEDLNNHFDGKGDFDFGVEEPSPEPSSSKPPQLLTKKRKSQAWDSKPLENRRKSHNLTAKPLDSRRKTMYCTTNTQPVPFTLQKPLADDHVRFENNAYYSEGAMNPNRRTDYDPLPRPDPFASSNVEIEEPLPFFYDEHMNDYAPPLYDLANLFIDPEREDVKPVSKIMMKRRKSEDWDSRPLENPGETDHVLDLEAKARFYDELDKTKHPDIYPANVKKQEHKDINGYHRAQLSYESQSSFSNNAKVLSRDGSGDHKSSGFKTADRNGTNSVVSGTKGLEDRVCPNMKGSIDFDVTEQRRTKWTSEEVHILWRGILLHGNNWSIIKDSLPTRTYYQIKDKGRRILYNRGWKTGRTKKDAGGASDDAKIIAQAILQGR